MSESRGRRAWLRTLGLGALGAPLLARAPFLGAVPSAEAQGAIRRIVFFTSGNESIERSWWLPPGVSEASGTSSPLEALHPIMSSLEPFRERLLVLGGAVSPGGGHPADKAILTGHRLGEDGGRKFNRGTSFDQFLADRLDVRALVFPGSGVSFRGTQSPATAWRAHEAFRAYFGEGGGGGGAEEAARARDASLLDGLAGQLGQLRGRIPAADLYKLEAHLDGIRDLERRLEQGVVSCDGIAPPDPDAEARGASFRETMDARAEVLTQALACNATRVAVFPMGGTFGFSGEPMEERGVTTGVHDTAHAYAVDSDNAPRVVAEREICERLVYEEYARLLARLDAVPEGSGTLLDHTLVVFVKWMGYAHSDDDLLWMVAGGQGATEVRTGRYLELATVVGAAAAARGGRRRDHRGPSSNGILAGLAGLMGERVESFGEDLYDGSPMDLS